MFKFLWHVQPTGGAGSGRKVFRVIGFVIGGVLLAALFALAFGWLVMLLWNWLMPALFGLKAITYWQGFGLVILAKLLFGAIGSHRESHGHHPVRGSAAHDGPGRWFEKWFSEGAEGDWKPAGSYENWRWYADYWRSEGKAAFEKYIERMRDGTARAKENAHG
ncbi:MAG: hypothetical protein JW699_08350 [Chitinispirillaceae bacterium]|nr:hypothetical protein [Chitinispirillaceae bacterium]